MDCHHCEQDEIKNSQNSRTNHNEDHHEHHHDHSQGQTWFLAVNFILFFVAFIIAQAYSHDHLYAKIGYSFATIFGLYRAAGNAFTHFRNRKSISIEVLLVIGASGALILESYAEGAMVVLFYNIGEFLEGLASKKAYQALKQLERTLPEDATVINDDGTKNKVALQELVKGNFIEILPGARVPVDAQVVHGESEVNEAVVSGEFFPVHKSKGDEVFAGTINMEGVIVAQVVNVFSESTLSKITRMVTDAKMHKSHSARLMEKFSKYYTPAVLGIAILIPIMTFMFSRSDLDTAIYNALTLILIACPCALVLSAPVAVSVGLTRAARLGFLMKGGQYLEGLSQVDVFAFDKTGTLTEGKPKVVDVKTFDFSHDELIMIVAALESASSHPFASAISEYAESHNISSNLTLQTKTLPGKGLVAIFDGEEISVGSLKYLETQALNQEDFRKKIELENHNPYSSMGVLVNKILVGIIYLQDKIKDNTPVLFDSIKGLGKVPVVLTGDNRRSGQYFANEVKVEVKSQLSPQDKLKIVESLQKQDDKRVAFVGDGINDAPVLAQADVGIAIREGTAMAIESAGVIVISNQLHSLGKVVKLSATTRNIITQNIIFAVSLKFILFVGALFGETPLWAAVLGDTGATLIVILNSLRLFAKKL